MGVEVCMNKLCKESSIGEWKKGWSLISGGFAKLCNKCGLAYENSVFCDQFHRLEAGWRECNNCKKLIHCGCIVSKSLFEYLDFGGIGCVTCVKASQLCLDAGNANRFAHITKNNANDRYAEHTDGGLSVERVGKGNLMQLRKTAEAGETSFWPQAQRDALTTSENNRPTWETKSRDESLSLKISLGTSSRNCVLPSAKEIVEGKLEGKASSISQQGHNSYPILAKQPKTGITLNLETNKGMISLPRIGRPPADVKGKNQLLSRYWPRITDQELEKLSGDLKSKIVPLFEKVLSPSDAGRIGRLVLPKACAEAFLPPIDQSEGVPLLFQDIKGNEWTFQFRFWPNNNSRMYVLEGVTPCIQFLRLNAGDTVTFSRIDSGEKFVLGFRRASGSTDTQDDSTSAHSNGISTKDTNVSGATKNLNSLSSFSDLLQSMKGNREPYLNGHSKHLHLGNGTADWLKTAHCEEAANNGPLQQQVSVSDKKKTCKIGTKTKRLHIRSEDSLELRLTWEEAQDLLCPPPNVKPNIVQIDDQVFEEYDEPPVFGKGTITNACPSGSPCSASEQLGPNEQENLQRTRKEKSNSIEEDKLQDLDTLASMAILGDNLADLDEPTSAGITTKHPRHRDGCTCIVCIQSPSGQGKHKPTCTCLACETLKRRSKTLMMRKKKNQSESEAAAPQNDQTNHSGEADTSGDASRQDTSNSTDEVSLNGGQKEAVEPSAAGQLDLNCHPDHEDM
ncbi:B3 domain-containing transcription repressor val1-like protein [Trifolium pratense]|uniref:B3 domain-containing transcription repressor val1-like protein n=1 Tax=Trifolium pratense TaxID=57577 RepID=A0A2K3P543_TRIPR|nr:B3 domain-containing transcription repressor val1-like protein [Trifolium pratense]